MTKHIGILISPSGERFYDAYGPMTKLRDRATRFVDADIADRAARNRFGRHDDAFWNSERTHRDRAAVEYRDWTNSTEEVADEDVKREGYFITDYARDGVSKDKLYAVLAEDGAVGWSRELGDSSLWPERSEASKLIGMLPRADGRAFCIESY